MHYEIERLNLEGRWLKTGKLAKKYKLLSEAQLARIIHQRLVRLARGDRERAGTSRFRSPLTGTAPRLPKRRE